MKTKRIVIAALVVVALSPATVAHATKYWKNSVITGNWTTGNNWSAVSAAGADNGGVPVAGEAVNIVNTDGTARTVTYDVNAPSLGLLSIDLTGAGTAASTLSLPNNNNLTAAAISVGGYNGTGFTSGRGAVSQSAGTTTISPGWDLILGFGAGSTGTYTLSGGALVANQSEWVGHTGTGTFNHSAGTNTINANAIGSFFVGYNAAATGTYNLSGTATLTSNHDEYIGYEGIGNFNQTGGTHTIIGAKNLFLGHNSGLSTGTYTISGGTLSVGNNLIVGNSGTGTLTIQTNASVHVTNNLSINNQSNVNLNGGTLRVNTIGGAGGLSRLNYTAGTIKLAGNRDLLLDSTITTLFGATPTIPTGKALTVEAAASIYSNPAQTFRVAGGTLTSQSTLDVGKEIGSGQEFDGHLEVTNGGIVNSGQGEIGFDFGTSATATVSGPGSTWNVGGVLWVGGQGDGAVLNIRNGALVHVATTLNVWSDGVVNLDGGTIRFNDYLRFINGVSDGIFNFNAGTIQLAGNRSIGSDATIADILGAAPTLTTGKGLTVEGTATLLTTVTLDGGTLSANQLANGNNLRLQHGTLNITNQAVTIGSGGLLGSTLDLASDMTVNVTLGITNQGLVTGDGQLGGTFANAAAGQLRAEPGRSLKLTGANNTNSGQINLFGGQLEFTQNLTNNAGAFISGNGTLITAGLTNNGTMNFSGSANIVSDVTSSATGKIISSGGGPTTFFDDVVNNGEIRTSAGSVTVFFGTASGAGTYTGLGTVNFEGDLKPGNSAAAVSFAGDVAFGPDAALEIEIGGTTAGSQHDKLNIAGDLALDGALDVSLINGFMPSAGQSFNILDWFGSLSGTFEMINLPTLSGLSWNTSQLYTTGVLSVAPAGLPGDYNGNGAVDAADYVLWRKNLGSGTSLLNDDTPGVGPDDYTRWSANFGQTAGTGATGSAGTAAQRGSASSSIPEPGSLALAATGLVGLIAFARRRKCNSRAALSTDATNCGEFS